MVSGYILRLGADETWCRKRRTLLEEKDRQSE